MKKTFINNFLDSVHGDKKSFVEVYGTQKLFDPKFMLIADIVSEHKELLSDIIMEKLYAIQEQHLQIDSHLLRSLDRN